MMLHGLHLQVWTWRCHSPGNTMALFGSCSDLTATVRPGIGSPLPNDGHRLFDKTTSGAGSERRATGYGLTKEALSR
jgi:hypothetical protein